MYMALPSSLFLGMILSNIINATSYKTNFHIFLFRTSGCLDSFQAQNCTVLSYDYDIAVSMVLCIRTIFQSLFATII